MAHEISLEQAAEKAHQAEVICRMMEVYPNKMDCTEIEALSSLLRVLTGDVCAWLIEEQAVKNNK
ncbi:TPA: hypothetical protein OW155_002712 [Klebsiella pneumoniae]|uniref:hypothetical protein n=1 Tax=Klebsiella pneumoniae TaxID=573 RepID=UPI000B41A5E0|nr:hypothetical protein [Klebsiella pneumoniae]EKT4000277.1 hypothetical protein [Klebsiella pneumoniae]EKV9631731.1 hypothetical protein [Klebsiella pneumoniae]EKV9748709.1 hypothetical protein [Klebsiella pneumoniae]EKW0378085.1 hypothetical protein [Klebsiella pneumoniae]EKW1063742.1 hypothetical protein [Klebsiella pneumoniae]